jgi:hypothetical protein
MGRLVPRPPQSGGSSIGVVWAPPGTYFAGKMTLYLLQVVGPNDCILSGLCGLTQRAWGPPSGVMVTAVGLVVLGVLGLRTLRRDG